MTRYIVKPIDSNGMLTWGIFDTHRNETLKQYAFKEDALNYAALLNNRSDQ